MGTNFYLRQKLSEKDEKNFQAATTILRMQSNLDGYNNYATIHIVVGEKSKDIKKLVREELTKHNIIHTTIELENASDECINKSCQVDFSNYHNHKHHH